MQIVQIQPIAQKLLNSNKNTVKYINALTKNKASSWAVVSKKSV